MNGFVLAIMKLAFVSIVVLYAVGFVVVLKYLYGYLVGL